VNHKCVISGELIIGISQVNENWWYGRIGARTGMFPITYVWQLESKLLKVSEKTLFIYLRNELIIWLCIDTIGGNGASMKSVTCEYNLRSIISGI
jgi:hypothetical protein